MDITQSGIHMLNMFTHPVFQVKNGIILAANQGALALPIQIGTPVNDILCAGTDDYLTFSGGSLSLTLGIGPVNYIAAVVRADDSDYFHVVSDSSNHDLQALALASQQLRDPISNVIALADGLIPQINATTEKDKIRIAQFNQNLHRLLRAIGNMSDAHNCAEQKNSMELLNIPAVIRETVEAAQQHTNRMVISDDNGSLNGLADRDLLERAVFNLISNALRHSDPESEIHVNIRQEKNKLFLTVENTCTGISTEQLGTIFFRYRRIPSITDGGKGIGLGIPIIQAAAAVHKGTLLVTIPRTDRIRFSLTIPAIKDKNSTLRSPIIRPDYAGGYDRSLIELADVLPCNAYETI